MVDPLAIATVQTRQQQRRRQGNGERGQSVAAYHLQRMGLRCIAPIATPVRVIKGKRLFKAKVSGDFYALTTNGRGVLVEVKSRAAGNLPHSALESHQRQRLEAWQDAGGLALLAWVRGTECRVIHWQEAGRALFYVGSSITWGQATDMHAFAALLVRR